jgi:hypothetical protein
MKPIQKLKDYSLFLREMTYSGRNEWQVALRKRNGKTLYQGNADGFYLIPNSIRYWRADPFLFTYHGCDYLFVEMFDRWKKKGVLGVCRIRNGKCGRFKVCLELPWHLSYPCVFEDDSGIYMIPECYQSGEVWIYRCEKFPCKWKRERRILSGYAVDTTPYGGKWLTTIFTSPDARVNDNLWLLTSEETKELVKQGDFLARSAGHVIYHDTENIRPSQNCAESYGSNIQFNKILPTAGGKYQEEVLLQIYAPDAICPQNVLRLVCDGVGRKKYDGIHTYNLNKLYEVVDLRIVQPTSIVSFIQNYCQHIKQKSRKR